MIWHVMKWIESNVIWKNRNEMCSSILRPSHVAKREWKYANTKDDSKDKYLVELPITVQVPDDFIVKGKR